MMMLHKQMGDLRQDLAEAQNDLDKVKTELSERDSKLREKTQELSHLTNKVKVTPHLLTLLISKGDNFLFVEGSNVEEGSRNSFPFQST